MVVVAVFYNVEVIFL